MIKKFILITATLMATSLWADTGWKDTNNWTVIGSSSAKIDYYLDLTRLRTVEGLVYAYVLRDYGIQDEDGTSSSIWYKKVDCGAKRNKDLKVFWFKNRMAQGDPWQDYTPEETEPWQYHLPGSAGDMVINTVCAFAGA